MHEYLPTLTRKGTIFRASQVIIDQRQAELIAFIQVLFSDDMPALIKEIRVTSIVSEFFALWGTDSGFAEKSQTLTGPRKSSTNSVFSSYFSASHPSLPSGSAPRNSPPKAYNTSHRSTTPRPLSLASSTEIFEEPDHHAESSADTSLSSSSCPAIAYNVPIVFGYNYTNQFSSILEVLSEEQDILSKPPEPYREVKIRPTTKRKTHRSYSTCGLSLQKSLLPSERLGDRSVRESWKTADSQGSTANDLLNGLGLVLPHPIKEQKFRASIASTSTFMTTDSAAIPQMSQASSQQFMPSTRIFSDADVPDAFPRPIFSIPESPEGRETPVGDLPVPASPSSIRTAFSTTSTLHPGDSISIKAIHDTSIILLRVPRGIGFAEVRQRLYTKFIGQEGIPLSETFIVAFVPPNSPFACSVTSANRTDVQIITLESDWEQLMSTLQGNKIILYIQDISTT